jgi:DNA-binding response OmpR family regulator
LIHQLDIAPRFGTKSRALVVDGHATSRSILVSHLRRLGVGQVLQCDRAQQAMQQMQVRGFDVLLCEHRLADGTLGQDLINELRRLQLLTLRTVVIMLSATSSYDVVAEVAESALDGFLIKPYTVGALEDRLLRAFVRKESIKEILDAVEAERYTEALALCEERFNARGAHWTHAARIGAELAIRLEKLSLATAMVEAVWADRAVPWAKLGLARVLAASNQTDEAVSTIQNLLSAEPSYADAYDVLGKIYAEQGDMPAAINAFRQAAEITPSSLVRAQKHAMLAYYAGEREAALQALERAAALGAGSPRFDPQTLILLALARYRQGSGDGLQACRPALITLIEQARLAALSVAADAAAALAQRRLQRLAGTARVLDALIDGRVDESRAALGAVADDILAPEFDIESATNLLSLLSAMSASGTAPPAGREWVRSVGLRFCASRGATEVLARACDAQPVFGELLRKAYAEISEVTRHALGFSIAGQHRQAIDELLAMGESTRNAKLLQDAVATLARYRELIDEPAPLQARCDALRLHCGVLERAPAVALARLQEASARPPF